jgi:hypothetical protein
MILRRSRHRFRWSTSSLRSCFGHGKVISRLRWLRIPSVSAVATRWRIACDGQHIKKHPAWSSGLSHKKSFERACGDSGVASTKRALPRLSLRTWRRCKAPPFSWPAAAAKRKPPFGEAGGLSLLSTGLIRERVRRIRRQRQSSTRDDRHREKPPAVTTSGFELGIRGSVWSGNLAPDQVAAPINAMASRRTASGQQTGAPWVNQACDGRQKEAAPVACERPSFRDA